MTGPKHPVTDTPGEETKDFLGTEVKKGDYIAAAFTLGRGAQQRVGRVVGFTYQNSPRFAQYSTDVQGNRYISRPSSDKTPQMIVEWFDAGQGSWILGKTTKMFPDLARFIILKDFQP